MLLRRISRHTMFYNSFGSSSNSYSRLDEVKIFLQKYKAGKIDLIKKENGIAHVVINHPQRRNAMSGSMMVDLLDVVEDLESWADGVGLILRGSENDSQMFCSGGDLTTVKMIMDSESGFKMATFMAEATTRLRNLPLVSVCLLDGSAIGGGAEMVTVTDYRLATSQASVAFIQPKMGVAPGWGGASRLVEILGRHQALDLLLTCKKVNVQDGLEMGLFNGEVSHEYAMNEAEEWLLERVGHGRDKNVVRAIKEMVVSTEGSKGEAKYFAPLWGGKAQKDALSENIKHR